MKTKLLLSTLLSFIFYLLSSQVPQGFNYQAIARDGSGNPISGATINVKLSILSDTTGFFASGGSPDSYLWEEEQLNVKTNAFGLFTVIFGNPSAIKVQGSAANFISIDWAKTPLYIGTKIANPTEYKNLGSAKLWSVPYSMVTDSTKALLKGSRLSVVSSDDLSSDALFEVRRKDGQIVFAVYPDAVNVYLPLSTVKGATKGGFAIGGFDQVKGTSQNYFVVNPDSIRAYINANQGKGATKGGFAIGGFDQVKGEIQDLLKVSNDSIRMYINDISGKGATKGGFAIGGFDQVKGARANFLNVATESTGIINPSQNRILWYPIKNAFLAGKVLIEKPDSVGVNSFASGFESKAMGQYSQALGFQAIARGDYSTAIGKNAIAGKTNSFAFGDGATVQNIDSYSFGAGAIASGYGSYAIGSAGRDTLGNLTGFVTTASGDYSFALGQGSRATGKLAFAMGYNVLASGTSATATGSNTLASGIYSTAMGYHATASGNFSTASGYTNNAIGFASVALGYYTNASKFCSTAMGQSTWANGDNSTAMGIWTTASGDVSTSLGGNTIASGIGSTAMGISTKASGFHSTTMGSNTMATADFATAMGRFTTAPSYCETVIGVYNTSYSPVSTYALIGSDRLFSIGNGTSNTSLSNAVTVLKNGSVGVGTDAPGQKLDIIAGNASVQAGYSWLTSSDVRYKMNIFTLDSCLEKVMAMRGVSFDLIKDSLSIGTQRKNIGFIAQELEKYVPEVVVTGSDGYKAVSYDKITAVLTEAIKEQQKQIVSQQKEIDELKTLVNNLISNQTSMGNN